MNTNNCDKPLAKQTAAKSQNEKSKVTSAYDDDNIPEIDTKGKNQITSCKKD